MASVDKLSENYPELSLNQKDWKILDLPFGFY